MNIIFLSELANHAMIEYMRTRGSVILIPKDDRFDSKISSHPDLVISIIDDTLIVDKNVNISIFKQLNKLGVPYVLGNSTLGEVYPQDIAYNAVITNNYLVHKLDNTNPLLYLHSKYSNKSLISVKQGYTKCSTVVVGDDLLITSDQGIYHTMKDLLPTLKIHPGHVLLDGYAFGFLGGASCFIEDTVVFHGDLSKHPDFLSIMSFLETAEKEALYFDNFPLTDIGSILVYNHKERKVRQNSRYQKHVNIPIFISHEGCPNDCVFCNQRKITSKPHAMSLDEVEEQIKTYSSTLFGEKIYIELAFFGGSFTGIDSSVQENYLKLAYEYKKSGTIQTIRLSTRPDYITKEILDRLRLYEVDTIELGVQSLEEEVLKASNRGHVVTDVYSAVALIKDYGFQLGIQLMVGLPADTKERAILSSKLTCLLKPDFVRIYPTLVIRETELLELCNQGKYSPLSLEEAVDWTKEMYRVFLLNQILVIRIGLQPTDLIAEGKEVLYGPFHPAFRQLVETSFFLDEIKRELSALSLGTSLDVNQKITLLCNPKDLSQVIGHNRSNIIELNKEYLHIKVISDESIKPMTIKCVVG